MALSPQTKAPDATGTYASDRSYASLGSLWELPMLRLHSSRRLLIVTLGDSEPQSPTELKVGFQSPMGPQASIVVMYLPHDWGVARGEAIPSRHEGGNCQFA